MRLKIDASRLIIELAVGVALSALFYGLGYGLSRSEGGLGVAEALAELTRRFIFGYGLPFFSALVIFVIGWGTRRPGLLLGPITFYAGVFAARLLL